MKKILTLLLSLLMFACLFGCSNKQDDDIYILYTNDIHCAVSENLGYAGISYYVNETRNNHKYVTLVDSGDFYQGGTIGSLTKGEAITEIMNQVGYDIVTIGNHDFDFGMDKLKENLEAGTFDVVACNFEYTGKGENKFTNIQPYKIVEYGKTKIAYIGVMTPESVTTSTPKFFKENDEFVYSFYADQTGDKLALKVQDTINEVKDKVNYVILLCHLGVDMASSPFTSRELASKIYGADVIIDGHSHTEMVGEYVTSVTGDNILITSTGTAAKNVGQLIITKDGTFETVLVSGFDSKDPDTETLVNSITAKCDKVLSEEIGTSEAKLSISIDGVRAVRSRETTAGNFVADALRGVYGSDIAIINGGGIRHDIEKGTVTYGNLLALSPFGNNSICIYASGQQILDVLEVTSKDTESIQQLDGEAVGESGAFLQVSGLKYSINCAVKTPVVYENGFFKEINGDRRVYDVQVLVNGKYEPIDPNKEYTVASTTYLTILGGDGNTVLVDCKVKETELGNSFTDLECIIKYFKENLNGVIPSSYNDLEGRITVK